MDIKITVLNTNTTTNETTIEDYVGEPNEIEIVYDEGGENHSSNEFYYVYLFLCKEFGDVLKFCENFDFDNDIENIFPFYSATDIEMKTRGYIYDLNEKDGIKTRIILFGPKHH
jgi:hypothetical protein